VLAEMFAKEMCTLGQVRPLVSILGAWKKSDVLRMDLNAQSRAWLSQLAEVLLGTVESDGNTLM